MVETYRASDSPKWWANECLLDFSDYSDSVEYINGRESGYGDNEGDWWYPCIGVLPNQWVIYYGTHGNDHSPGASYYTFADVYDNEREWMEACNRLENMPEYLESALDVEE